MAPTTQRGKKAAETRLENIEQERRDNEHLVREMEGGRDIFLLMFKPFVDHSIWTAQEPRKAKNKAMEVAGMSKVLQHAVN